MAKFPTMDEMVKGVAEKALEFEYEGKTIHEWAELVLRGKLVEVIRCKDCANYHEFISGHRCVHFNGGDGRAYQTSPDDFCSHGERKNDG